MTGDLRISEFVLSYPRDMEKLRSFLCNHHLTLDSDVQVAFGVLDRNDQIRACGCAAGALLKCFAVDPRLRGQNILGSLISKLVQNRFSVGLYDLFIVTRTKNREFFVKCGFYPLVETRELVLLENRSDGPKSFATPFMEPGDEDRLIGSLVMNCNPFTLGHQALVEFASQK